jgi:two-component system, chemotaxis family, sensor kinase CheA
MIDDLTLQLFFEEAAETVRGLEEGLLRLERAPEDAETLNGILRGVHTLKGNSAMLGFDDLVRFVHVLEDALMRLREGAGAAPPAFMDLFLASADVLRGLLQRARDRDGRKVESLDDVTRALEAFARGQLPAPEPVPPAAAREAERGSAVYAIRFSPPPDLLQRGLDPMRILESLGELGEVVRFGLDASRLPSLEELDPERAYLGFDCWLRSAEPRERIEACFEFVGDPAAVSIEAVPDAPDPVVAEAAAPASEAATIRVATERVDRLVDLVGELIITHAMVAESVVGLPPDRLAKIEHAVTQMGRHVRALQDRVMAVRMLPIRVAFGRIRRTVRDLAQALGKQVVLETSGEDTELDKSVIEQIGDPLIHLVRNAVDHGIERPEARRQAGKPEAGRLNLGAYQQGGSIYVEVTDDGQGLDREAILVRAAAAGLLPGAEPLSDEQVFGLIFQPGFSTAERVTETSGRGIGLDVVKRNVDLLGGSVAVHSERGRGTTFRLKLPLTLAILDGQTLRVGGETYILPLASIVESVQSGDQDVRRLPGGGEIITRRSDVVPILRLARLFGVRSGSEDAAHRLVVIVEDDGRRLGLLVDELLDQQQVVIKSLDANFRRLEGIAAATVLGDGRVALILDVPGLVELGRSALGALDSGPGRHGGAIVGAAR